MKKIILLTIFSFTALAQAPQNLTNVGQINWFGSNQLGPCNWKVNPIAQTITAPCLTSGSFSGDAISLQGVPISAATPTTGQALLFNGTVWLPQTPVFTQGTNITITGSWPNLTISSTGVGSGNVTTGGTLTSGNIITGAGSQAVQDSGTALASLITASNSATFTNKNISGLTNFFTNIPNSALVNAGATTINGTSCIIGASCSVGASGGVTNFPATIFSVTSSTASYATGQTPNLIFGSNSSGNVGLFSLTPAMLPVASAAAFGGAKCDGTTITCSGGVFVAVGGASNATSLQGTPVSSTPPTTNQVLQYNGTSWFPTAPIAITNGLGVSVTGTSTVSPNINMSSRKVTGTTDTILPTDCGGLVVYNSGSAVTVGLPQAGLGGNFISGCVISIVNYQAAITINASTSLIGPSVSTRLVSAATGSGSTLVTHSLVIDSDNTDFQIVLAN